MEHTSIESKDKRYKFENFLSGNAGKDPTEVKQNKADNWIEKADDSGMDWRWKLHHQSIGPKQEGNKRKSYNGFAILEIKANGDYQMAYYRVIVNSIKSRYKLQYVYSNSGKQLQVDAGQQVDETD